MNDYILQLNNHLIMKNTCFTLLFMLGFALQAATAQQQSSKSICLKMAGSYFIDCKRTIAFGDYSLMNITGTEATGKMVSFEILDARGNLAASLKNGQFTGPGASQYEVYREADSFMIAKKGSKEFILRVKTVHNKSENRNELHIWANFYLPDGNQFQCTPDESNLSTLEMMKGSSFVNNGTAIQF
jgi:hypothetical protein